MSVYREHAQVLCIIASVSLDKKEALDLVVVFRYWSIFWQGIRYSLFLHAVFRY